MTRQTPFDLTLLAEHEDFLIADKPPGLSTHQDSVQSGEDFTHRLRTQLDDRNLFPCHRLDKDTSGLLIVAKGSVANSRISQLFESRQVEKIYLALSAKKPRKKQGLIQGDMDKSRGGNWKLNRSKNAPALTQFFSCAGGDGMRLFVLKPLTGKTHQLRVAMKSLSSPILGDERYGGLAADRCYLHATALRFSLQGREYCFYQKPDTGHYFSQHAFKDSLAQLGELLELPWPKIHAN